MSAIPGYPNTFTRRFSRSVEKANSRNGNQEAFLVDFGAVPEPSTYTAIGFLTVGTGWQIWRRRLTYPESERFTL